MNQARETRPWEGRVVATEGGAFRAAPLAGCKCPQSLNPNSLRSSRSRCIFWDNDLCPYFVGSLGYPLHPCEISVKIRSSPQQSVPWPW
jgi:hypothetical protein